MTLLQAFCPFCRACHALMRIMTGLVFVCAALVLSAGAAASGRDLALVGHHEAGIVIHTGMAARYGGVNAFLAITPSGVFAGGDGMRSRVDAFDD